jgi:putative transposase
MLSTEAFLEHLVATKQPQIFAESAVHGDGSDWTATELSILGDIGFAVPVSVYDNGRHHRPDVYEQPFPATLLFIPGAPNRLEQDFSAIAVDQKWVSDITYIWTEEGWLYLAAVLDLYSRSVVGWAMAERMTRELVMAALTMAVRRRRPGCGLIVHSDRGSQYASEDYQALLESQGFLCSMSRKGDCYDNATMESFFHSLKVEQVHDQRYRTRDEAKADIFEYIETYYNPIRRPSALSYLSPRDFEKQRAA